MKNNIIEEFDLYWGLAPKGTPKYKAGEKAKQFLLKALAEQERSFATTLEKQKKEIRGSIAKTVEFEIDKILDECKDGCWECGCIHRKMVRPLEIILDNVN